MYERRIFSYITDNLKWSAEKGCALFKCEFAPDPYLVLRLILNYGLDCSLPGFAVVIAFASELSD